VLWDEALQKGEIVLLHNTKKSFDMSNEIKLHSYQIHTANKNGSYRLEELDGTTLQGSFNGNCLKKYYKIEKTGAEMEVDERDSNRQGLTKSGNETLIPEDWNRHRDISEDSHKTSIVTFQAFKELNSYTPFTLFS
jgi:hypothetical protein